MRYKNIKKYTLLLTVLTLLSGCILGEDAPQARNDANAAMDARADSNNASPTDASSTTPDTDASDAIQDGVDTTADAGRVTCSDVSDCEPHATEGQRFTCLTSTNTCAFSCKDNYKACDPAQPDKCFALNTVTHCGDCATSCPEDNSNRIPACEENTPNENNTTTPTYRCAYNECQPGYERADTDAGDSADADCVPSEDPG
ncbi:hypothetical protein [Bradymonas sediminis]|uniref:Uncharacterized protein n=1 Tax=Bradymonas sediminis TaxID=1548548 RepID=A0A2Z4FJ57_9DELT|nr:hypothetical protein [Bradymonas sediminis]AWV88875.1 hypothetical protein DN745_05785 [Bradymonas sediminis]TDP71878.1 hypothetical protein DFR33_10892 [Bradymonas sediminis]